MKNKVFVMIFLMGLISNIFSQNLFRNGIFLHHSSGEVIWGSSGPNVPQLISMYNAEKNYTGSNAVSLYMEPSFFPSLNNGGNYYDTWHAVFVGQSAYPQEDSLLHQFIQNNKVIIIKACWGGAAIAPMGNPADTTVIDDEASATGRTYYRSQWHWRSIVRVMQSHPDRFFVIWTAIPLNPGPSYNGTLAHNFFLWAKDTLATGGDPNFGPFPSNVYIFDAFHLLAVPTQTTQWGTAIWGMNPLYHDPGDNHPNSAGANAVAHQFIWETFDAAIAYEQGGAATFPLSVNVSSGWNMVSIPGLLPSNQNVSNWWPGKDPNANVFRYQSGYQAVTSAEPGKGYWMKNVTNQTYNTGDEWPAQGISIVSHSPIQANAGWNLFGGYNQVVNIGNITTTPSGLITGTIYKYTPGTGYVAATQLVPGYGYWVKLTANGSINVPAESPSGIVNDISTEGFGKIIITDNTGKSCTLYSLQDKEVDISKFDLPPAPPQGMFDIRYSSQRYAEDISTPREIEMSGVQYPVKIKSENRPLIISDGSGKETARLEAGEEFTLTSEGKIFISGEVIPDVYSLEQNYPNPFNPSTTIQFSIPEDVKNLKLIVYNSLGEKAAELVNTGLKAGTYKYSWNGGNFASGIYVYKLISEKFVSTRKMILLK